MNSTLYYVIKVQAGEKISPSEEADIDKDMSSFAKGKEVASPFIQQVDLVKVPESQAMAAMAGVPIMIDTPDEDEGFVVDIRYGLDEEIISVIDPNSNKELAIDESEMLENSPVALGIFVSYPRSDRFGVPCMATEEGASKLLGRLGFAVTNSLDVTCQDTGDDSGLEFVVKAVVSPHCVAVQGGVID